MRADSAAAAKQLNNEFEAIAAMALEVPLDTDELVRLKEQVAKARATKVPELTRALGVERKRIDFLLTHTRMSVAEMETNTEMFTWLNRFGPIFEKHEETMGAARMMSESKLRDQIKDFKASLEGLAVDILECENW